MVSRKSRDIITLAMVSLLISWLIMSSIQMIDFNDAKFSGNNLGGLGGFSTGKGSGFGSYGGSGFTFPSFNFSLGSFNFNMPVLNLSLPVLPLNFSFLGGSTGHSARITNVSKTNATGNISVPPAPPSGSGGVPLISIPMNEILLVLMGLVVAAALALAGIKYYRKKPERTEKNELLEEGDPKSMEIPPLPRKEISRKDSPITTGGLMKGWGGSSLFSAPVPEDLPLVWETGSPIPVVATAGTVIETDSGKLSANGPVDISPGGKCMTLLATNGTIRESHTLRTTEYSEDVINTARMNMITKTVGPHLTMREIIPTIRENGSVLNQEDIEAVVREFERALYGSRKIGRSEYYSFLRSLRAGFISPSVPVCGSGE